MSFVVGRATLKRFPQIVVIVAERYFMNGAVSGLMEGSVDRIVDMPFLMVYVFIDQVPGYTKSPNDNDITDSV